MALEFKDDENLLVIHIPNSEASVDAQHNGGKDTTVGSYYMSEMQPLVFDFLNDFEGDYFIDFSIVLRNSKKMIDDLLNRGFQDAFKQKLEPQKSALEFVEWMIANESPLYKMPNPSVNENNKYLKFDNMNQAVETLRTLCLGELSDICIKRIGQNGYIIYNQMNSKYYDIINNTIYKWVKKI